MYFGRVLFVLLACMFAAPITNANSPRTIENIIREMADNPAVKRARIEEYGNSEVDTFEVSLGTEYFLAFQIVYTDFGKICMLSARSIGLPHTMYGIAECRDAPAVVSTSDKQNAVPTVADIRTYETHLQAIYLLLKTARKLTEPVDVGSEVSNSKLVSGIREFATKSEAVTLNPQGAFGVIVGPYQFYMVFDTLAGKDGCTFSQTVPEEVIIIDVECDGSIDSYENIDRKIKKIGAPTTQQNAESNAMLRKIHILLGAAAEAYPNK